MSLILDLKMKIKKHHIIIEFKFNSAKKHMNGLNMSKYL
jgi:hypothetical protein